MPTAEHAQRTTETDPCCDLLRPRDYTWCGIRLGRRRFGTIGAKDGRPGRDGQRITKCERPYDRRYDRHGAKAAGQRDERRVGPRAHAAHLAGSHAFLGVVHRADLTGQQARAALFVVPAMATFWQQNATGAAATFAI
jgi:hypothetical protein